MPVLTEQHWIPPQREAKHARPLELAGWVADTTDDGAPHGGLDQVPEQSGVPFLPRQDVRGKHAKPLIGTPAEGFHRSLSWSGPIGDVVTSAPQVVREGGFPGGPGSDVPPELTIPSTDPAAVGPAAVDHGMDHADGIIALWEEILGRTPIAESMHNVGTGLLSPGAIDLTSGQLAEPRSAVHTVPHFLLHDAMTTASPAVPPRQPEVVPLEVPGEFQENAAEIPNLSAPLTLPRPTIPAQREARQRTGTNPSGLHTPLQVLGQFNALDGAQTSVPAVSHITEALEGRRPAQRVLPEETATPTMPRMRAFTGASELSDVAVTVLDEFAAATPTQRWVADNPSRPARTPRTAHPGGMALPVFGGGLPEVDVVQNDYLPNTGLAPAHAVKALHDVGARSI